MGVVFSLGKEPPFDVSAVILACSCVRLLTACLISESAAPHPNTNIHKGSLSESSVGRSKVWDLEPQLKTLGHPALLRAFDLKSRGPFLMNRMIPTKNNQDPTCIQHYAFLRARL